MINTINSQGRPERVRGPVCGLNNIGLLVRTSGTFSWVDDRTFTLDDGSGATITCVCSDAVALDGTWAYVTVTGISSCERLSDGLHPVLRISTPDEITPAR